MPEERKEDLRSLTETIRKLEEEVRILKSSQAEKKSGVIFRSAAGLARRVFSRENLEIFLSSVSLVISVAIASYLIFFQ